MATIPTRSPFHHSYRSPEPQGMNDSSGADPRASNVLGTINGIWLFDSLSFKENECCSRHFISNSRDFCLKHVHAVFAKLHILTRVVSSSRVCCFQESDFEQSIWPLKLHHCARIIPLKRSYLVAQRASIHSSTTRGVSCDSHRWTHGDKNDPRTSRRKLHLDWNQERCPTISWSMYWLNIWSMKLANR